MFSLEYYNMSIEDDDDDDDDDDVWEEQYHSDGFVTKQLHSNFN